MAINAGASGGAEAGSGESTGRAFVRRSSGLVRDVSPLQALFFSMAAVLGGGIAFTFQNMTVTFQPMWEAGFTATHGRRSRSGPHACCSPFCTRT